MNRKLIKILVVLIIVFMPQIANAERDTVIYQSELNYPPFKFNSNGYLTGFDMDISNMIFNNKEYMLNSSADSWDKVYERLKNGEIDTCGMLVINDERKKEILFSKPLFRTYTAVYTKKDFYKITLNNISDYSIGVGKNQYSESLLTNKLMIKNYKTYNTIEEALIGLKNDEIDILFENQEVVNFLIVEKGLKGEIIYQINDLFPQEVAYGFSKSRPDLLKYTNARLDEIIKSGTFDDFYERYFFRKSDFLIDAQRRRVIILVSSILLGGILGIILIKLYINKLHRELYNEKELLKEIIDSTNTFVIAVNSSRLVVKCNKNIEKFGLRVKNTINREYDDIDEIKKNYSFIITMLNRAFEGDFVNNEEIELTDEKGGKVNYSFKTGVILDSTGVPDIYLLSGLDITERKEYEIKLQESFNELEATYEELVATEEELKEQYDELSISEERLRLSEERFRLATEAANDAIWEEIPSKDEAYYSDRWYEILGYPKPDSDDRGEVWRSLVHPEDEAMVDNAVQDHFDGKTLVYKCEYRLKTSDGNYKWFLSKGRAIKDFRGKIIRFIGSSTDITEIKSYQFSLQKLAYFDSLTNLPNKASFKKDLEETASSSKKAALLYIDLDNFKYINDTMGHSYGDQVLISTGYNISKLIGNRGNVYRLGGDEFSAIIFYSGDKIEVEKIIEEILEGFKNPLEIQGVFINISLSIGVSLYPEDSENPEILVVNSDIAMYKSKELGKGTYTFFSEAMRDPIQRRITVEKYLSQAIENSELYLQYQPQLNIKTGKIDGFEALLRWNNPFLGHVPPLSFINIAEESRLIIPIGEWVMKTACGFIKKLSLEGFMGYRVAVNISIVQLMQQDFVDRVMQILKEAELEPEALELEITESILMESFDHLNNKLMLLKSKGIKIALDDFGTGYSSLSYLRRLKVNTLKIDKAFINDILLNERSKALTKTIIEIGHQVGLEVIAEGVEDKRQLKFLEKNNCDKIQGYLFSKPIFENEVKNLLGGQQK